MEQQLTLPLTRFPYGGPVYLERLAYDRHDRRIPFAILAGDYVVEWYVFTPVNE